jgi:hypothetical protein
MPEVPSAEFVLVMANVEKPLEELPVNGSEKLPPPALPISFHEVEKYQYDFVSVSKTINPLAGDGMPVRWIVVILGGKRPLDVLDISSMALASAELPVVFTATLCAFAIIVKLIIAEIRTILRIVANKTILFINNYFKNQNYMHD